MDDLGPFRLRRKIGEGGMATVYEAEDRQTGRVVALKLLQPELARSEEGRRRFLLEMKVLSHLEHPNIVKSLGSLEIDGQLVLVLEYLEGKTLRQLFESEPLAMTISRALDIAVGVASALVWAHERSPAVVHRDLKPENLMVMGDGSVKVMDFGIAKVLDDLQGKTSTTQTVGTAQYMSPEQADAKRIGPAADLYGLGLVVYEMVAGQPPFRSDSLRELLTLQCTAPPPPLPSAITQAVPGLEPLLRRLLAKAPADRPASAREVCGELARLRAGAPPMPIPRVPFDSARAAATPPVPATPLIGPAPVRPLPSGFDSRSLGGSAKPLDTIELIDGKRGGGGGAWVVAVLAVAGLAMLAAGFALWFVAQPSSRGAKGASKADSASASDSAAPGVKAAGDEHLAWEVPSDWVPFRNDDLFTVRAFRVPHVAGDPEDAELIVRAPGTDPEELIATVRKSFSKCKDPDCELRSTRDVHGMPVSLIELRGVYFPIGEHTSFRDWAMLFAAAPVGKAYYSFRFTGPDRTVKARHAEFDALVASLRTL